MKEFENNFYIYEEEKSKLRFYSDEFERLLSKCGIKLDNIELKKETGDIFCYVNQLNYNKLNCKKFDEILKTNIPYIQDIFFKKNYFVLTFNVENVELS